MKITLDEMIAEVKAQEALIKESEETGKMIRDCADEIIEAAKNKKIRILTDYDADGITSAYIMEKLIKSLNRDCDVSVQCNDRRGSYGLSALLRGGAEKDAEYIILDMGSNQLEEARQVFGNDMIMVDHHLFESEENRLKFLSKNEPKLLNPHAINKDDSLNAKYCSAGLAKRLYEEAQKICSERNIPFETSPSQENTVKAIACIGTASDVVDVMDLYGYNRRILKEGVEAIDNADESNFDFVVGYVLVMNKISEHTTAHQLAFNVGAFLNSASRMSDIVEENGAQRMFEAITADPKSSKTYKELEYLALKNKERKDYISSLVLEPFYIDFVQNEKYGENKDKNITLYQLPDDVPPAFAGLIAGKLAEACDKAVICVTYNNEKGCYTGSGRNAASNKTSLMDFMKIATQSEGLEINYGGHADALGISNLNNIKLLQDSIEQNVYKMVAKSPEDKTYLDIDLEDVNRPETLKKLLELEPVGQGLSVPPVLIKGEETRRDADYIRKDRNDWKRVSVKTGNSFLSVSDWSYSPLSYPIDSKKGEIAFTAELVISDYRGQHVELAAKFDRNFLNDRTRQLQKDYEKER